VTRVPRSAATLPQVQPDSKAEPPGIRLPFGVPVGSHVTPGGLDYNPRLRSKNGHLKQRVVRALDERAAALDRACRTCSGRDREVPACEIALCRGSEASPPESNRGGAVRVEIGDTEYAASPASFDLTGFRR